MKVPSAVWSACLLATSVLGQGQLNGFPANPYDPYCAMSCLRSLSSLMLGCSNHDGDTVGMMASMTSSSCWASDTPYLTSLAWCMHTKCAAFGIPNSKLEYFWETQATGQSSAGVETVPAKWSYAEALAHVTEPPTIQLTATDTDLNTTSLVSPAVYLSQWNVLTSVQTETARENGYGIAMLVTGFGTPIVLTMLGYMPFVSGLLRKLKPYLVWPSTIGTYQVRPLPYFLGNAPTVGQSLYVAMFIILNIILTAVNYHSLQPNAWYSDTWREIMAYVLFRTGIYAYIMAPLIFLFAGRNNILLWLTNWSHSTFLVLHRWVARVFTLQALLHSILAVILYKKRGIYEHEVKAPYWIWGIVATLCAVILTFGSGLYVRSFAYEFFLIKHIVLSVILVVACWYHAYDLYAYLGGYQIWLSVLSAVWFFDRLVRVARIAMSGPRRARVTDLGEHYVRIDVPGIRWGSEPGKHVYVYFPTLNPLRPWENHPFSILPTALLQPSGAQSDSGSQRQSSADRQDEHSDIEKRDVVKAQAIAVKNSRRTVGLTLYVRKSTGMTKSLRADNSLLTFLEGPYPNNSTREVLRCDRLLLIGGGIGITGLLPFVNNHWDVKLAWSVKESAGCLVHDLDGVLRTVADKDVRIGTRLNVKQLLADEMEAGWEKVGVVVSGPGGLCDDVRAAVVTAGKLGKTEFELEVEAYSW
ncbi:ferric reductase like transmembrane component-domain-containing protein [Lineolata rhizophorae]|uniref:Ferric reductase like transmembrane component-domain-containing protein n=1 Tax=Lineolata rhizophorae TaxID=578093 RepID=A0A6A6NL09_9PEZI|nr:ferric reductase like transmembrane component-domain-containing protein [Lineolata rhizophorae]